MLVVQHDHCVWIRFEIFLHDVQESQLKGLTKAQKRRHFDKFGAAEEKPRGWNWVDILSHLAKGPVRVDGVAV